MRLLPPDHDSKSPGPHPASDAKRPRGVLYVRVSTEEQASSGAGLDGQTHSCREWSERHGFEPLGPFSDPGISGAAPVEKRPGLLAALAELGKGDALVVAKRDRLGRDPMILGLIEATVRRLGARVVSVAGEGTDDDSPSNVLMRRIVDAFAEFERLIVKARTRAALDSLRRRGRVSGVIPYGQAAADDGQRTKSGNPGRIVADLVEAQMIDRIGQWDREGVSPRQIARLLTQCGYPTRRGGPWHHSTVRSILRRCARPVPSEPTGTQATQ